MSRTIVKILVFGLTILLFGCISREQPFTLSEENTARLDSLFVSCLDSGYFTGCVAYLEKEGAPIYEKAFGLKDAESNIPMQTDDIFRIASMTKPVTCVAIMKLYEQGLIKLDDPISKYIPGFEDMKIMAINYDEDDNPLDYELIEANKPITIHHLLTHTSGITYVFKGQPFIEDIYRNLDVSDGLTIDSVSLEEMVDALALAPLMNQPGEKWQYGLNSDVLGRLIEVITNKPLNSYLREAIFDPLEMQNTYFNLPGEKANRLVSLYYHHPQNGLVLFPDYEITLGSLTVTAGYPLEYHEKHFSGGAGLVSTANDYARFCSVILGGGKFKDRRILNESTIEMMLEDQLGEEIFPNPDYHMGLGFVVVKESAPAKGFIPAGTCGWTGIFNTIFWIDSENEIIGIFFSQVTPGSGTTIFEDFQKLTYEILP